MGFVRGSHRRRVGSVLMAIVLGVALSLVASTPASAAGCSWSSCNGKDPASMGCGADAYNLESFWYNGSSQWLQGTLLELRYSPSCHAAWVRTTGGDCFDVWRPCIAVLEVSGGSEQWTGPNGGQNWTNMWSFAQWVRGCFRSGVPLQQDGCTAWR